MSVAIPMGERENERREFKSVRALDQPETIARAVVALLNAEGGEVWVGLRDEGGVAVELEGVEEAEEAARRLLDSLVDTIEPSPRAGEVEVQPAGTTVKALRIAIRPVADRKPYGVVLPGGGRRYVVRVGDQIRPLSREELRQLFTGQSGEGSETTGDGAEAVLRHDLEEVLAAEQPILWLGIEPCGSGVSLDLDELESRDDLTEPRSTGNRAVGRTFYVARRAAELGNTPYLQRRTTPDGRSWLVASGGPYELAIGEEGALRARAPLEGFKFSGEEPNRRLAMLRGHEVLNPRALVEYPTSIFRLLGALLRDGELWPASRPEGYRAGLTLVGVEGWYLRPDPDHPYLTYPIDPVRHRLVPPEVSWRPQACTLDPLSAGPLTFERAEAEDEPDSCAYRLLRIVFAAFGEAKILSYDPTTRRFTF